MGPTLVKSADQNLQILPRIADLSKDGGWIGGAAGAPSADAGAELNESGNEMDLVREEKFDVTVTPSAVAGNALRPRWFVVIADGWIHPMTDEHFTDFFEPGDEPFRQTADGPIEQARLQDFD